jgi:hypothetical protein
LPANGILNAGGGASSLDESYQLAGGNNPGGISMLDFLLEEIENRVGNVRFRLCMSMEWMNECVDWLFIVRVA